ncbi:MAG: STAS domain-containing protein [Panacagrimonas sp.]
MAATASVIRLPAELGIESASDLHRELIARVEHDEPVVFDAADVTRIHTAALQLFCLFCRDRRSSARATHWKAPSAALRSGAALLGVTALMNLAPELRR